MIADSELGEMRRMATAQAGAPWTSQCVLRLLDEITRLRTGVAGETRREVLAALPDAEDLQLLLRNLQHGQGVGLLLSRGSAWAGAYEMMPEVVEEVTPDTEVLFKAEATNINKAVEAAYLVKGIATRAVGSIMRTRALLGGAA